jgi:hypothetical protein
MLCHRRYGKHVWGITHEATYIMEFTLPHRADILSVLMPIPFGRRYALGVQIPSPYSAPQECHYVVGAE